VTLRPAGWAPAGAVCHTRSMTPSPRGTAVSYPEPQAIGHDGGRAAWRASLRVAAGLAVVGGLVLAADIPVARWCRDHRLPGGLARVVDLSEVFAHGLGVTVLLAVTIRLDPDLRRGRPRADVVRLIAASFTGGLVVDVIKAVVTRVRPRAADLADVESVFGTFGTTAADGTLAAVGLIGKSADLMSFPSGHAATAAGLATALAWRYPSGTAMFAGIAICAAAQRVVSLAHYPSDVAFGAAIGVAAAACCMHAARRPPVGL